MIISTHLESSSGNEHEFVFDVDIHWTLEERNPYFHILKQIDIIVFNWCLLIVGKHKRDIDVDKIVCVSRKAIEDRIIEIVKERNQG